MIVSALTGDAVLRWDSMALGNGASANATPTSGAPVTVTAPAGQFITKVSRSASNVAVDPSAENFARLIRLGNDTADTLAGVVAVFGLAYTLAFWCPPCSTTSPAPSDRPTAASPPTGTDLDRHQ